MAKEEGAFCIKADVLCENTRALRFLEGHGFLLGEEKKALVPVSLHFHEASGMRRQAQSFSSFANARKPTQMIHSESPAESPTFAAN